MSLFAPLLRLNRLQWFTHAGSLLPFIILIIDGLTNNLTVNPIQEITQRTGRTAIIWLLLSLACTPLNIVLGLKPAIQIRRPLGLYAAFYAFLHFLTFVVLDNTLNMRSILRAVGEKPFVFLGLTGLILLGILTLTSTNAWKKRLRENWRRLHRLVYPAAVIVLIHYFLALKNDFRLAIAFSVILILLFIPRIPAVRRWLVTRQPVWVRGVNRFLMEKVLRK